MVGPGGDGVPALLGCVIACTIGGRRADDTLGEDDKNSKRQQKHPRKSTRAGIFSSFRSQRRARARVTGAQTDSFCAGDATIFNAGRS